MSGTNPVEMVTLAASGGAITRLDFIDNLRWVMIVLVVSMHAAVTYSHLGSWYFMEDPKPGLALTAVFATYQTFLQAFFMGLLFLIAGYFVPGAFDRKGFGKFLRKTSLGDIQPRQYLDSGNQGRSDLLRRRFRILEDAVDAIAQTHRVLVALDVYIRCLPLHGTCDDHIQ